MRERLGHYLPDFYMKLAPLAWHDTIRSLKDYRFIEWTTRQCYQGYDAQGITAYMQQIKELTCDYSTYSNEGFQRAFLRLDENSSLEDHISFLKEVEQLSLSPDAVNTIAGCSENLNHIFEKRKFWKVMIPTLRFYKNNQYHRWLFGHESSGNGFISGDLGTSVVTGKKVSTHIGRALPWTLILSLFAIVISMSFSTLIGVGTAYKEGSIMDKVTHSVLFMLYTIPTFWLATLLLMLLANPDYLNWFPSGGVAPLHEFAEIPGVWTRILASSKYLLLPLVCFSYGGIATLSRLTRSSAIESFQSQYAFSARTRGLTEKNVVFKHVLINALLPMITMVGAILPSLFGGSVIIERIFSIPGMGQELINGTTNNDLAIIMAIFTISGLLSAVGYLLSDILYQIIDPRIKLREL